MDPKGYSSKKNSKKKLAPKSNYNMIDDDTDESNGDLVEYPMKRKVDPRKKRPWGKNLSYQRIYLQGGLE